MFNYQRCNLVLPFNNKFDRIKIYGSIVKLNGLTTWLFNDDVVVVR